MFEKKKMTVVASESGAKIVQFEELRKELFHPKDDTNKATDERLVELARIAATAMLQELHDEKKATYKYLSVSESDHSWKGCSDRVKEALLGKEATNDRAESALGGTTQQVQAYGRIGINNAAAVSDAKRNGYFKRFTKKSSEARGMFHQFNSELRECLIMMAIEEAPATMSYNRQELAKQRECRRLKEEMLREKGLTKAKEDLIEAYYYHRMYHSDACWKGDPKVVAKNLKRLKSDTAKFEALKENIKMRVIGFGWKKEFGITWSVKGQRRPIKELSQHLRKIIRDEQEMEIPPEPNLNMPQRASVPVMGTATKQREDSDKADVEGEAQVRKDADEMRREREARGETSMYALMQPFYRPELVELEDRRIDVLCSIDLTDNEKVLRWCQGKVLSVVEGKSKPTVRVCWDAMSDVKGSENEETSDYVLLPSLWNKDKEGAWRMDVNIELRDGIVAPEFDDEMLVDDGDDNDDDESEDEESELGSSESDSE